MSLRSSFFSLQLILTLLAASIVIFSSQLCVFHVFFFRNKLRLLSFFCFVFRSSSFSVIGVGVVVVGRGGGGGGGGRDSPERTVTSLPNFLASAGYHFFLSHARELRKYLFSTAKRG